MLYIVGTPIGNLEDLSNRQANTLIGSDIILAEDTRSAGTLLSRIALIFPNLPYFPNHRKLISYYKDNEFEKLPQVIQWLKEDKNISLISESGMPLISDPGYLLIKTVINKGIRLSVIPGPSAATTALVASGLDPNQYMFLGYFPKKKADIIKLINKISQIHNILPESLFVFYESPHRIKSTLQLLNIIKPDATIVIGRELTKKFEEIIRGKAKDIMERSYKGEITLILQL